MKFLYVPFRSKYVKGTGEKDKKECIFCKPLAENNDEKNFILARYKYNFVILNLYPYNAGHLMIVPFKHCAELKDLSKDERDELMELISKSCEILKKQLKCEGFNVGLNLGKAAGAGIPNHLHMHVLPRWLGDTNFLPTLCETKTISFDLHKIYSELKPKFNKIKI